LNQVVLNSSNESSLHPPNPLFRRVSYLSPMVHLHELYRRGLPSTYSKEEVKTIKSRVKRAAKKHGVEISED
jgi:hypothetical protein